MADFAYPDCAEQTSRLIITVPSLTGTGLRDWGAKIEMKRRRTRPVVTPFMAKSI